MPDAWASFVKKSDTSRPCPGARLGRPSWCVETLARRLDEHIETRLVENLIQRR